MVYMCLGVFFLIVFGFELAYTEVWLEDEDEDNIEGHPVRFNNSILIPVVCACYEFILSYNIFKVLIPYWAQIFVYTTKFVPFLNLYNIYKVFYCLVFLENQEESKGLKE